MSVAFQVQLKIRKPLAEVFDAVADEKKLTGYFVQNSSGPFVAGQTLTWKFDEAPQPTAVVVREVVKNQRIVFDWPTSDPNVLTTVTIAFVPIDAAAVQVAVKPLDALKLAEQCSNGAAALRFTVGDCV